MARARRAATAALVLILSFAAMTLGAQPDPRLASTVGSPQPLAAVAWPPSSTVLLAEVVTGGASASDEYVELTNGSATTVDLAGLELVYATSSGTTVTRKATWPAARPLEPGQIGGRVGRACDVPADDDANCGTMRNVSGSVRTPIASLGRKPNS